MRNNLDTLAHTPVDKAQHTQGTDYKVLFEQLSTLTMAKIERIFQRRRIASSPLNRKC